MILMYRYSIVIPTYNEEADIANTIARLLDIEWKELEIIIVDDSNDGTRSIIRGFDSRRIKLICPTERLGRCGARNLGIRLAKGDVVIILNADVHLPRNFIALINKHYMDGADVVMVKSVVSNTDFLFARYVGCVSEYDHYYKKRVSVRWTEGYSCRRDIALEAGLFPDGYPVKICAGEDAEFGLNVMKLTNNVIHDESIVCSHVCPSNFHEYWQIRMGRGKGGPQVRRFLNNQTILKIIFVATLRLIKTLVFTLCIFPYFFKSIKYLRFTENKNTDWFGFPYAMCVEDFAFVIGECTSIVEILKNEKRLKSV